MPLGLSFVYNVFVGKKFSGLLCLFFFAHWGFCFLKWISVQVNLFTVLSCGLVLVLRCLSVMYI